MAYQRELFTNTALLLRTSICLICRSTRKISCILNRYDLSNMERNIEKRWQDELLLLAVNLPKYMTKRGKKKKMEGAYHIRTISSNDKTRTLEFLMRLFFRDEPLARAAKLVDPDDPNSRCMELEEYTAKAIEDGISLAAVGDNGELAGVVINSFLRRSDKHDKDEIEKCPNPKFQRVLRVLVHTYINCQLWDKVPSNCDTLVDLKIASTDPKWRGRSIMKKLAAETESVAKKHGACGMHMVATSVFSARAAERLKYNKIYAIKFAKIPDAPRPEPPHDEVRIYLKLF